MSMTVNSMANNALQKNMLKLSAGSRINSAADDAAGLAISEKLNEVINGLDKGTENTYAMGDLVNTADSALSGISDSLQRVRELSIQSLNGTLSDSDRSIIQNEIQQTLSGINDVAKNTEFNTMKLLDGSFQGKHVASDADGGGKEISIKSMSLKDLGLENYNITGNFDLSKIDSALDMVNSQRAELGATSNTFQYTITWNDITNLNLAAAKSRIADTDMAKASMDYNKDKIMNDYSMAMQNQKMQHEKNKVTVLF